MAAESPALRTLLWLTLLLAALAGWPTAGQAQVTTLRTALATDGAAASAADWRTVALPDDWAANPPGPQRTRRYRIAFEAPADAAQAAGGTEWAVYVERVCTDFELHLNGARVHRDLRADASTAHHCGQPHLVSLPGAMMRAGGNELEVRVSGHALAEVGARQRAGGLSAIQVAPRTELAARHALRHALMVELPKALALALLLVGLYLFAVAESDRRENHLNSFGALAVGWAATDAGLWLHAVPLNHAVAEFLLATLAAFLTLAAVQFLVRESGTRHPAAGRWLLVQCAAMPLSLIAAGPQRLFAVAAAWHALLALQVAAAAVWYWRRHPPGPRAGRRSIATLLALAAVAAVAEAMAQWRGGLEGGATLTHAAVSLAMICAGLRLIQRHGQQVQENVLDRGEFEERLREATEEIERNFSHLAELRVEQVTERERKRIAADLHDDLGAKLLTIVHTSESERISTLAREALEEMRLSVRGLTGRPVRLADALGDWRAEVVSRLAQAGIQAEWDAPEDLVQMLQARTYVQTTRILREATSNVIKHSGASHCDIACTIEGGGLQIVIRDDGTGIPMELDGRLDRGHGMASMKQRAKQLQGQCLVESAPGYGTVIRLTVPLDRPSDAP